MHLEYHLGPVLRRPLWWLFLTGQVPHAAFAGYFGLQHFFPISICVRSGGTSTHFSLVSSHNFRFLPGLTKITSLSVFLIPLAFRHHECPAARFFDQPW